MGSRKRKSESEESSNDGSANKIHVKISSQIPATRETVHFAIRENFRLGKVFKSYCDHESLDYKAMQFVFNGQRVNPKQTPRSLHMFDGDEIDALTHCGGGA